MLSDRPIKNALHTSVWLKLSQIILEWNASGQELLSLN